jgi:hypothetical protein
MKKIITMIGVYLLTVLVVYLADGIFQVIYYNIKDLEFNPIISSVYTVAGLIGVCTYILYKRK